MCSSECSEDPTGLEASLSGWGATLSRAVPSGTPLPPQLSKCVHSILRTNVPSPCVLLPLLPSDQCRSLAMFSLMCPGRGHRHIPSRLDLILMDIFQPCKLSSRRAQPTVSTHHAHRAVTKRSNCVEQSNQPFLTFLRPAEAREDTQNRLVYSKFPCVGLCVCCVLPSAWGLLCPTCPAYFGCRCCQLCRKDIERKEGNNFPQRNKCLGDPLFWSLIVGEEEEEEEGNRGREGGRDVDRRYQRTGDRGTH